MKKRIIGYILLLVLISLGILAGCASKNEKPMETEQDIESSSEDKEDTKHDNYKDIMANYYNIIEGENEPFTLVRFINENIDKLSEEEATEMIIELENVQEEYIELYTDQLFTEGYQMELLSVAKITEPEEGQAKDIEDNMFFDRQNIEDIKNGDLKEQVEKIMEGKYKLINMEGAFYPIIDYQALKDYDEYLTIEIKDYIHIKAMDSNMPVALDAEIIITFEELSERLVEMEKYISKYPDGLKRKNMLELYGVYLETYMEGLDNSPIYNYDTGIIKDEVMDSYRSLSKNTQTVTSEIILKYVTTIEENGYIVDDNMKSIPYLKDEAIDNLNK